MWDVPFSNTAALTRAGGCLVLREFTSHEVGDVYLCLWTCTPVPAVG